MYFTRGTIVINPILWLRPHLWIHFWRPFSRRIHGTVRGLVSSESKLLWFPWKREGLPVGFRRQKQDKWVNNAGWWTMAPQRATSSHIRVLQQWCKLVSKQVNSQALNKSAEMQWPRVRDGVTKDFCFREKDWRRHLENFWPRWRHRYIDTLLPSRTNQRRTTSLKTKYNLKCQKIELAIPCLYGSLTSKGLKKKHSSRPIGGAETGSWGGEDSRHGGRQRTGVGREMAGGRGCCTFVCR